MHPNAIGKINDVVATLAASGIVAMSWIDVDLCLKLAVGFLTIVFLTLGCVSRARELRAGKTDGKPGTDGK